MRLRVEEFERWSRGEIDAVPFEVLSARDGLRVRECNGWGRPAVSALADGTLIYPTVTGIALLDPTALETPELSPFEVYVDRAWTGDRELDPGGTLELTAKERHLGLRFGALEFLRPESVAFRYRLEGANPDWLAAVRRTEAVCVVLPLSRPGLAVVTIFTFLYSWDEFPWAHVAGKETTRRTLPIAIALFQSQHLTEWGQVFAASIVALVPVAFVFILFQRYFIRGIATTGLKG